MMKKQSLVLWAIGVGLALASVGCGRSNLDLYEDGSVPGRDGGPLAGLHRRGQATG